MEIDIHEAIKLINEGKSQRGLAKELGISDSGLRDKIKNSGYVRENGDKKGKWIMPSANSEIATSKASNINNKSGIIIKKANAKDEDMKADIQALIQGINKKKDEKLQRNFYADKDIAHFLDNIPHGNKSELINKIIRQYLIENDLI